MALYVYLHFPALQCDSLTEAGQQAVPLAVVDAQHSIIQLNEQAAAQGVQLRMGLATAAALCHNLQLIPYQEQQQQALLMAIAQQLYQLSGEIAPDPPAGLYLRGCSMLQLYHGLDGYQTALLGGLKRLPYRYAYASAATPFAAKCLALQQFNQLTADHAVTDKALKCSPLSFTELETEMQQQLQRLGIDTLGRLLALSAAELARRFDHRLISYLGRLRGEFFHALDYIRPEPGFSRYLELLYDISDVAVLSVPLQKLLQQLEQQLERNNALCHQLTLHLYSRDSATKSYSIGSAQGEYRAVNWLRLCQLQLESSQLTAPVYGLQLEVTQFAPQQAQSDDLFAPQQGNISALQLVSLLQARLGRGAISGLSLQNQHLPEHASGRPLPLLPTRPQAGALLQRPAFLLPQPRRLHEAVEISSGPERLCADGWQLAAQRDYFIGRNQQGQWLWLYRTAQQQWFVHGLFS
ncbi:MAG: DNA polymerase Y family protein [Gammaproteobacteria bacterium]|nr:DNA polymerase Y family protein [Gammaproteobacteria bacterium]MBU1555840.1 DNA polymerase Y family protein [Gammaproteobacteria bacterium]MBU2071307.1 DNA polymerase Y family protein [Gammaproteobacteria bacterium]MBU2181714.1 DNA polymerase Y family protein [Gammaproteobacteria bacterium]MBU2205298.1 DNA polymerase Y family protein [Gammaproteobacteria bacterium]